RDFHVTGVQTCALPIYLAFERMDEYAQEWEGRVRTLVVDGPTMSAIDETVRHRNSDLVVAASRGATATRMVLLGTVAEGLLDAVPCDVLIARARSALRRSCGALPPSGQRRGKGAALFSSGVGGSAEAVDRLLRHRESHRECGAIGPRVHRHRPARLGDDVVRGV